MRLPWGSPQMCLRESFQLKTFPPPKKNNLFPVAAVRLSAFVELVASPQQSARHQIQILRALHRRVGVAERRAEHATFSVRVYPDTHMLVVFFFRRDAFGE